MMHRNEKRQSTIVLALLVCAMSCATGNAAPVDAVDAPNARYLFAWTGDEDRAQDDFMAVVDLAPHGNRYGRIVATTPVGEKGLWPHHTEPLLDKKGLLFANGYAGNRSFLFDVRDAMHPKVVERFSGDTTLSFLHSFERLANGHVIATFQSHGPDNVSPGGIAELDEHGRIVRRASASDPLAADQATLRPYGLTVVPALDRIVVAMTFMPIPTWHPLRPSIEHEHDGNQLQVYRLSDLKLIKTIRLPSADAPNEPRLLRDGKTVLVNTVECRLYRVTGLEGTTPGVEMIYEERPRGCAMPVVMGDYWIQAHATDRRVYALNIRDLAHVTRVSSLPFDEKQRPHWLATDGDSHIVLVNEPGAAAERRIWMLKLDHATGMLTLDSAFRDSASLRPGLAFDRQSWPHGASGTGVPHGTVFSR